MSSFEIRAGTWRALASALRLAGTKNVQELQVEPAQPVLDMWPLTRYGAQQLYGYANDGWVRYAELNTVTLAGFTEFTLDPYDTAGSPEEDARFWIDRVTVLVDAVDISDFLSISGALVGFPVVGSDAQSIPLFLGDDVQPWLDANQGYVVNKVPDITLPVPKRAQGNTLRFSVQLDAAPAGDVDVYVTVVGRFLPKGIQPRRS